MIRILDIQVWRFSFAVQIELSTETAILLGIIGGIVLYKMF